jgi:serine/threonine-protein kinase
MSEFVGKQLGNYRLLKLLGQGGFADVYLGVHIHLNTQAAIKVLQMRLIGSNMEQFRTEARTIASLLTQRFWACLDGSKFGFPVNEGDGGHYPLHGS